VPKEVKSGEYTVRVKLDTGPFHADNGQKSVITL